MFVLLAAALFTNTLRSERELPHGRLSDRRQGAPLRAECDATRGRARGDSPGTPEPCPGTPEPSPGTPESASAASVRSVRQHLKVPQVLLFTWSGLVILPGEPAVSVKIINSCV